MLLFMGKWFGERQRYRNKKTVALKTAAAGNEGSRLAEEPLSQSHAGTQLPARGTVRLRLGPQPLLRPAGEAMTGSGVHHFSHSFGHGPVM